MGARRLLRSFLVRAAGNETTLVGLVRTEKLVLRLRGAGGPGTWAELLGAYIEDFCTFT